MTSTRHLVVTAAESRRVTALAETLRESFTVRTAYSAAGLEESLDDDVDVVLVDPALDGVDVEELAESIADDGLPAEVGVLTAPPADAAGATAVDPDASGETLRRTVRDLADRATYRRALETLYDLAQERAALRGQDVPADRISELDDRFERARDEVRSLRERLDDEVVLDIALGTRP